MKRFCLLFVLIWGTCTMTSSCSKGNLIDYTITDYVQKNGTYYPINLGNELDFEWDSMFFFSVGCSLEEIQEAMGYPVLLDNDLSYLMVFLYEGHVVRQFRWDYSDSCGVIIETSNLIYRTDKENSSFHIRQNNLSYILEPDTTNMKK